MSEKEKELYNVYVMSIQPDSYDINSEDYIQMQQIINGPVLDEVKQRLFTTNGYKLVLRGMDYSIFGSIYKEVDAKTVGVIESMIVHLSDGSEIWKTSHKIPIPEINPKYEKEIELEIEEVCAKKIKIL